MLIAGQLTVTARVGRSNLSSASMDELFLVGDSAQSISSTKAPKIGVSSETTPTNVCSKNVKVIEFPYFDC